MKTWCQVIQGRVMRARSDYILGTYRRRFEMVRLRGIRNYSSYHFALQARLLICPTEAGQNYDAGVILEQMGNVHGGSKDTGS